MTEKKKILPDRTQKVVVYGFLDRLVCLCDFGIFKVHISHIPKYVKELKDTEIIL